MSKSQKLHHARKIKRGALESALSELHDALTRTFHVATGGNLGICVFMVNVDYLTLVLKAGGVDVVKKRDPYHVSSGPCIIWVSFNNM